MNEKEWLDTLPEDERLKVIAEHNKTIAQLKQPIDRVEGAIQRTIVGYIEELQATADRRLELLREIERDFSAVCMFCRGRLKSMGLGFEVTGHADDCRLAKELSDD